MPNDDFRIKNRTILSFPINSGLLGDFRDLQEIEKTNNSNKAQSEGDPFLGVESAVIEEEDHDNGEMQSRAGSSGAIVIIHHGYATGTGLHRYAMRRRYLNGGQPSLRPPPLSTVPRQMTWH